MDPNVDELGNLIKLLSGGGNVAIITLSIIAWQVWKTVRETLTAIRDTVLDIKKAAAEAHTETLEGQKRLTRAVAAISPAARRALDDDI